MALMSNYTILVVEDNEDIILLTKAVLSYKGYNVCTASNGTEGLKAAKENHPDLIILDVMMPDMDGYQVLEALKKADDTKDIPVAFLTAKTQEEEIKRGISLGAVKYFKKPFEPMELLSDIEALLSKYSNG